MILSDMDGVLATGEAGDTAMGRPIYRTFLEVPPELKRIHAMGGPLHVVTAKVEAQASQVLQAVGLESYFESVVGADRLFWPTVWGALKAGRVPRALSKSHCLRFLPDPGGARVVMIEDHADHLRDLLEASVVDYGILVPKVSVVGGEARGWFDLNSAFRLAARLAAGGLSAVNWKQDGISAFGWDRGALTEVDAGRELLAEKAGRLLFKLPSVPVPERVNSRPGPSPITTGEVLQAQEIGVVGSVRAGRRTVRRLLGRHRP